MPDAHAKYSPSGASKWMKCPGSMEAEACIKDERNSVFAAEGTLAHEIREWALLDDKRDPYTRVGEWHTIDAKMVKIKKSMVGDEMMISGRLKTCKKKHVGRKLPVGGFRFEVTEDMVDHLMPGIERVREMGGRRYVEKRVSAEKWIKDCWGTLDTGIILDNVIEINDLKFGAGVPVSPKKNKQLMIYALAFWWCIARKKAPHIKKFRLVIDQPRAIGGGGEWTVSLAKLLKFAKKAKRKQELTMKRNAVRIPGEAQCKFCKAKSQCAALSDMLFDNTRNKFSDLEAEEPEMGKALDLKPKQRALLAKHSGLLKSFLDEVSGRVLGDALAGLPTPGLKAVEGRKGPAQWKDEKRAEAVVSTLVPREVWEVTKIASPTAVRDHLKKKAGAEAIKALDRLVKQSSGKPVLVDEKDKKPALDRAKKFKVLE